LFSEGGAFGERALPRCRFMFTGQFKREQAASSEAYEAVVSLRRASLGLLVAWAGLASGLTETPLAPPADLAGLEARFAAQLAQDRFRQAQWGVQILSLDSGRLVFAHQADHLLIPASNTKLFTGALALDRLGPDFRIRTSLFSQRPPTRRGTLTGDLVIYGRGDPTFAARFHGGRLDRALDPLVQAVTQAGLKRIRGDLVADASYFAGPTLGSGWDWDDLQYAYGAEVSALSVNDNAVDVVVTPADVPGRPAIARLEPPTDFLVLSNACVTAPRGVRRDLRIERPLTRNLILVSGQLAVGDTGATETVSVPAPAAWFGHRLRDALERRGLRIDGNVRTWPAARGAPAGSARARAVELGGVESPPLREVLAHMLKPSQNLYAQLLLLQVGAAELAASARSEEDARAQPAAADPTQTAESAGIAALGAFLREAGIARSEVLFEEGSGLSRRHLVTPTAIVQLLRFMDRHRDAGVFREALPVAGVDGTLRSRMKDTAAAGNARAKTGTLRYVHALSGYVTSAAGERFAFAILLNNFNNPDPHRPARADLDEFVVTLAGLEWRTDEGRAPAQN
jgi:D-alanyl-D-alanine carboxypeptidase/D-alanyl-D-alanine-endopeptidase (penicillin-binding protein 4)